MKLLLTTLYISLIITLTIPIWPSVSAKEPNNLSDGSLEKISTFCDNLLIEDEDCINELIGCYLDDVFTVEQCQKEYLWKEYEASIK